MKNLTRNSRCRICGSKNLIKFLDFGKMPLANRFLTKEQLADADKEPKYPLRAYFCQSCYLVQLRDIVDREELFKNYIYFSSPMPKLSDHFQKYAEDIMKRFLSDGDFVVEIGSNDGILLRFFKDKNFKALGIDPAKNIPKLVDTVEDFFSEKLAKQIAKKHGRAKVIMANNVVAHINDHHDLLRGIDALLADDGIFVFEAPYLVDMFENLTYDSIYHEHLSCLSLAPLVKLFGQFGLYVFDIKLFPVQGQSMRVFVCRPGQYPISKRVRGFSALEQKMQLDQVTTYLNLVKRIEQSKNKLNNLLVKLKNQGKKIVAYGAPAKGNTLLNYCKFGPSIIDYALDDLPSKQGLYTPGMHIPVISSEQAKKNLPDYFLMLAWNYADAILKKEQEFRQKGGKFIMPINAEII